VCALDAHYLFHPFLATCLPKLESVLGNLFGGANDCAMRVAGGQNDSEHAAIEHAQLSFGMQSGSVSNSLSKAFEVSQPVASMLWSAPFSVFCGFIMGERLNAWRQALAKGRSNC
jgi:hypothetical protein